MSTWGSVRASQVGSVCWEGRREKAVKEVWVAGGFCSPAVLHEAWSRPAPGRLQHALLSPQAPSAESPPRPCPPLPRRVVHHQWEVLDPVLPQYPQLPRPHPFLCFPVFPFEQSDGNRWSVRD